MQKFEEVDAVALVERIESLTDEADALLRPNVRLTDDQLDELGEVYRQRGQLLLKLNELFYKADADGMWQKGIQFRTALARLRQKNNATTELLGILTNDASGRLRENIRQRSLIAYSHQS